MKKIFFVFLFCICCLNSFAQGIAPAIQWQNTIGGSDMDFLNSIQKTFDGGYILGGISYSNISGDKTENVIGGISQGNYWVVKLNSNGNIEWQNTIGGNGIDRLFSIQQTNDGGYILGGSSNSGIFGDKTENNWDPTFSTNDYWIIKLDPIGNIQWQKTIGGNNNDWLNSIQQTYDGGYIIGGYSYSNISGNKTEDVIGGNILNADYWVVKINSVGNIQWQNTFGGTGWDGLYSIDQTIDGGYFLAGVSNSNISGDKTENNLGGSDYWVLKIDSLGTIQWQNTIGGNHDDLALVGIQTNDLGYVIGGWSNSTISGDKTEDSIGSSDYWIVKLNSTGNINWQNTIGGNNGENLFSLKETIDYGLILLGGSASNISGDKTENCLGVLDYWVLKLNSGGNILWQKDIGGNLNDRPSCIDQSTDGGFILGGWSDSNISGNKAENSMGIQDYWVVKLAPENCSPCPQPTNPFTTVLSHTKAKLNWTTQPCAIGYKIRIRKAGTTVWSNVTIATNIGFKIINSFTPNTTYEWQVRSICSPTPLIQSAFTSLQTFTTPLRLEDETKTQNDFILSPNPATSEVKISNLSSEENQITIYNLLGQQVHKVDNFLKVVNFGSVVINISDLPSGIYMLAVSNNKKICCKKFVKK